MTDVHRLSHPARRSLLRQTWRAMTKEALLREYVKTRDDELCEWLLRAHDGIATTVASRYASQCSSPEDVFQVARIGLLDAIRRFDPDRGTFSAFAFRTVRGTVMRHLRDTAWPLAAGRSAQEGYLRVRDEAVLLTQALGRHPTVDELASAIGTSRSAVVNWQQVAVAASADSIDNHVDSQRDPVSPSAQADFEHVEARLEVEAALKRVPEQDRRILRLRFLGGLSQRQIGEAVGVNQMFVSRTLRRALEQARGEARMAG